MNISLKLQQKAFNIVFDRRFLANVTDLCEFSFSRVSLHILRGVRSKYRKSKYQMSAIGHKTTESNYQTVKLAHGQNARGLGNQVMYHEVWLLLLSNTVKRLI